MKFKSAKSCDVITYCLVFEMGKRLGKNFCQWVDTRDSQNGWIPTKCLNDFEKKHPNLGAEDVSTGFDGEWFFRVNLSMDAEHVIPIEEARKILLNHLNQWTKENL